MSNLIMSVPEPTIISVVKVATGLVYRGKSTQIALMVEFSNGEICDIATYYPDELSFTAEQFIGKTRQEAGAIYHRSDVAYLQS
jgi:hypothetical protein